MKKIIPLFFIVMIMFVITSCSLKVVTMPYGTKDYRNGDWNVDDLVSHFEELGFTEIEVTNTLESFGEERVEVYTVLIEDTSSDSWFTDHKAFEKGEEFDTWLKIKIETHTYIPTLTVDNCSEFSDLVKMKDSSEKNKAIKSFMNSHNGEYIEFDGTITDWYDQLHWVGISFSIAIDDSETTNFSWDTTDLIDLKLQGDYHYSKYKTGLINEGMRVHMIAKIVATEDKWELEICEMEII